MLFFTAVRIILTFVLKVFSGITFSVEIIINQFLLLVTTTKDQKTTLAKVEREAGKFVIFTSEFDLKGQKQYFKNNIFMLSLS